MCQKRCNSRRERDLRMCKFCGLFCVKNSSFDPCKERCTCEAVNDSSMLNSRVLHIDVSITLVTVYLSRSVENIEFSKARCKSHLVFRCFREVHIALASEQPVVHQIVRLAGNRRSIHRSKFAVLQAENSCRKNIHKMTILRRIPSLTS